MYVTTNKSDEVFDSPRYPPGCKVVEYEEATVEGEAHGAGVVVAVAGGDEGVREKEQEKDRDAGREKGRWIGKARELSQKLRRRSTVVFTGSPLASPTAVSAGSI